ncbi:MAG TPA: hypothetical protein VMI11_00865 [Actinomycetes bacterium]|nr:hypothetical protein [Actinomycetes bacterium]
MDKATLAVLNDSERRLYLETERAALEALDEDGVLALHDRIRKARNKYTSQYRRQASARVGQAGGRGKARPTNTLARSKAEAFEDALARVSRRLTALARQEAARLRSERLAAARAEKVPAVRPPTPRASGGRDVTDRPRGDRDLRSPASAKRRASTKAATARRQAARDGR